MKNGIVITILMTLILTSCSAGSVVNEVSTTPAPPEITSKSQPPITIASLVPTNPAVATPAPTNTTIAKPAPIGGGSGTILFQNIKKNSAGADIGNLFILDVSSKQTLQITDNSAPMIYQGLNWSPDGKYIVSSLCKLSPLSDSKENVYACELYLMDSEGKNTKVLSSYPQLTNNYTSSDIIDEEQPKFIDNSMIIFISNRNELSNYPNDKFSIFTINLNTSEISEPFKTDLLGVYPSTSPDGSKIAFSGFAEDWEIYIADLSNNGKITQLTDNKFMDRYSSWSPDGQQLVFHSDRDGNREIYTIKYDGTGEQRITNNPSSDYTASWSPDGQWLAYSSDEDGDEEVFIQNISTGERIQLTFDNEVSSFVQWTPKE
jgi:TolB protein